MAALVRSLFLLLLCCLALYARAEDEEVPQVRVDFTTGGNPCGGGFDGTPGMESPLAAWYCWQSTASDPNAAVYPARVCGIGPEDDAKVVVYYQQKAAIDMGWSCEYTKGPFYAWKKVVCPANSYYYLGKCYCKQGVKSVGGQCGDTRIKLIGPSSTKALPQGPVLPQIARVMRNGAAAAGVGVTVLLTSPGGSARSFAGITDAAGDFRFTYVPPYLKATVDTLSAKCVECSNEDQKQIVVEEPCDVCQGSN